MFPKFSLRSILTVLFLLALVACAPSNPEQTSTPTAQATLTETPTQTPLPQPTKRFTLTPDVTATVEPTLPPMPKRYEYGYIHTPSARNYYTVLIAGSDAVLVAPNYEIKAPGITKANPLYFYEFKGVRDEALAKQMAISYFGADYNLYLSRLSTQWIGDNNFGQMLPEGWELISAPRGNWSDAIMYKSWYKQEWFSVKGMVETAAKVGEVLPPFTTKANQTAYMSVTCEKSADKNEPTVHPGMMDNGRGVIQIFMAPSQEIYLDRLCPNGIVTGEGHLYTSTKGTTWAEKTAHATVMADALMERLFSKQTPEGEIANQCMWDIALGGTENYVRIYLGKYNVPTGFEPPMSNWINK